MAGSELAANLPLVMGYRVQRQQVIMKLMVNSIDAMKDIESHVERFWAIENSPRGASFSFTAYSKAEALE